MYGVSSFCEDISRNTWWTENYSIIIMTVWKDLNEEMHCSMQSFPPHCFQLSIMRFVYFTVNFITHTSALPLSIAERLNGVFCSTNRTTVLTRVNFYKKNTSKSVTIKRINIWMIAKLIKRIKWSEQTYWRIENSLSVVDDRAQNIGGKKYEEVTFTDTFYEYIWRSVR